MGTVKIYCDFRLLCMESPVPLMQCLYAADMPTVCPGTFQGICKNHGGCGVYIRHVTDSNI